MEEDRAEIIGEVCDLRAEAKARGDDRAVDILTRVANLIIRDTIPERALPATQKRGRQGYVYYASGDGGLVKIGYSRNPWSRTQEMRTAHPTLELIGVEKGDRALEAARHEQFAASRYAREWFRRTPELEHLLRAVAIRSDDGPTKVGAPSLSPTPPFSTPNNNDNNDRALVEQLTAMLAPQFGDMRWPDVDAFVKRRSHTTWKAWLKEIAALLTGGSADEVDVARACRDDEALENPIATPAIFRTFVKRATDERLKRGGSAGPKRSPKNYEHWTERKAREEREAGEQLLAKQRWGNVEQRKLQEDGELWWRRMKSEAATKGKNPVLYAFDHINEQAELPRASA